MCRQCMLARVSLRYCEFHARTDEFRYVRLGETSSMLVALRMLMASSDSCLDTNILGHVTFLLWSALSRPPEGAGIVMVIYVLAHVHVARASVERHLGRRELFPSLLFVVAGKCRRERLMVGVGEGAQKQCAEMGRCGVEISGCAVGSVNHQRSSYYSTPGGGSCSLALRHRLHPRPGLTLVSNTEF